MFVLFYFLFLFKQKTAYEMRISDWSSDVCSSDLSSRDRRLREAADAGAAGSALRRTGWPPHRRGGGGAPGRATGAHAGSVGRRGSAVIAAGCGRARRCRPALAAHAEIPPALDRGVARDSGQAWAGGWGGSPEERR